MATDNVLETMYLVHASALISFYFYNSLKSFASIKMLDLVKRIFRGKQTNELSHFLYYNKFSLKNQFKVNFNHFQLSHSGNNKRSSHLHT